MRSNSATSFLSTSAAFLALLEFVSATYFTSPQTSTVWQTAVGQTITWHYQAGGAAVGDIVLQAQGLSGSGSTVTVASQVDLTTESLTFPSGVALRSYTGQYELMIVNSQDPSFAYTTVGPFSIESFSGSASSSSASSSSLPSSTTSQGDNGLTEGAPHTATNPPVSTPVSTTRGAPLQTVTRSDSPSSSSSSTTSTRPAPSPSSSTSTTTSTAAESTISTSREESSSSSTTTTTDSPPLSTATVLSTASVATITSTFSDPSSSGVRTATIISAARPTKTSGATNLVVPATKSWLTGGIVCVVSLAVGYWI